MFLYVLLCLYQYSPVTYRIVGSLSSIISSSVTLPCAGIITHLYSLPFLTSFIIMFSTIRLLLPKVALYPVSMPLRKAFILYGLLFTSHPVV